MPLVCLLLISCSGDDSPTQPATEGEADAIQVGLLFPVSGSWPRGLSWNRAAQLAAGEINAQGGLLGRPLDLRILDTETVPAVAVEKARQLVEEGVVAIIGPGTSSATIDVAEQVTIPAGIPLISPSATSPSIADLDDASLVWRTAASDEFQGRLAAEWAYEHRHRLATVLYVDNAYGRGLSEAFVSRFEMLGGQVWQTVAYPDLSADEIVTFDYADIVQRTFVGFPDLIYMITYETDGAKITVAASRYVDFRYTPTFLGADASASRTFLDNSTPDVTDGMVFTVPAPAADNAQYQAFVERYASRFSTSPAVYDESTYDAVYLVALAILQANSADPRQIANQLGTVASGGTRVSSSEFARARELIASGEDIDYDGAMGALDFDEQGDLLSGTYRILRVVENRFTTMGRFSVP